MPIRQLDSGSIVFISGGEDCIEEASLEFRSTSEVRDSHYRCANIEIDYLLQELELHEGMVVLLATNLRKNLDDAFVHWLHFAVEFSSLDKADRLRIWSRVLPPDAPLAEDIELPFLAVQGHRRKQ